RIDATLGLFRQQLPLALAHARRTAKTVLRTLGAARDLDVQLAQLERYCAGLPENERAAAEPLQARLQAQRLRARARMVRALDSEPTRRWLGALSLASAQAPTGNGGLAERASVVMPERVRSRFRKLRKSVRRLGTSSSMEDYHGVRRRAKQLRYAIECGAGLFGKPAQETLKALRRLQDTLGAHQDAHMAGNRLAALATDPANALPPATLFLMGRLAEHYAGTTAQARKSLTRSWRKVRGKRCRAPAVTAGRSPCPQGGAGTEAHHATPGAGARQSTAPRPADRGDPHPVRRVARGAKVRAAAARRIPARRAGAAGAHAGPPPRRGRAPARSGPAARGVPAGRGGSRGVRVQEDGCRPARLPGLGARRRRSAH